MSALAGRRIVVTRARHQAERLAAALDAVGARPVFFPTIVVRPVDDPRAVDSAVQALAAYAWIVFTSANAVDLFWHRVRAAGLERLPPTLRVAAVGPATAEALAARGVAADAMPEIHSGAAVAGVMGALQGARVLLPRGDLARDDTADGLQRAGALVDGVTVYRTLPSAADAGVLRQLRDGVDAVTFTSPSTVRNFGALLGDEARRIVRTAVLATIGPTTSAAVRQIGWGEPLEAAIATTEGLVAALAAHFATAVAAAEPSA